MNIEKYKDEFLSTIITYKNLSKKSVIAYNILNNKHKKSTPCKSALLSINQQR